MNASREGRLRGQFEEQHAEDDSDLEEGADNDEGTGGYKVFARELDLIGGEDEMAPITLPRDPKVVEASKERRKIRQEKRIKEEGEPLSRFAYAPSLTDLPGSALDPLSQTSRQARANGRRCSFHHALLRHWNSCPRGGLQERCRLEGGLAGSGGRHQNGNQARRT